jgi:hypothetical protein
MSATDCPTCAERALRSAITRRPSGAITENLENAASSSFARKRI